MDNTNEIVLNLDKAVRIIKSLLFNNHVRVKIKNENLSHFENLIEKLERSSIVYIFNREKVKNIQYFY